MEHVAGVIERINPKDIVVGDILIMQIGDAITADSIVADNNTILCNESGLTGEPNDLKKSKKTDPFLLSSCLVTEGESTHALVIGIGLHSQWGKIKSTLSTEPVNTPLQDKLHEMCALFGYFGLFVAIGTFLVKIVRLFTIDKDVIDPGNGVINAFIMSVIGIQYPSRHHHNTTTETAYALPLLPLRASTTFASTTAPPSDTEILKCCC